jgi:hypothetical protein
VFGTKRRRRLVGQNGAAINLLQLKNLIKKIVEGLLDGVKGKKSNQ